MLSLQVVKIRMQAAKAGTARYAGTMSAYYNIAVTEGARGLWSGLGPSIVRYNTLFVCVNVCLPAYYTAALWRIFFLDFPLKLTVCNGYSMRGETQYLK